MEEISSHFRASLNRGNAARIQDFDIIFEQDLSWAFQNIFPIENRIIFVVFRPNFQSYSYRQCLTNLFDVKSTISQIKSSTGLLQEWSEPTLSYSME